MDLGDEDRVVAELENHRHENMLGVKDMAAQGKAGSLWMRRGKKDRCQAGLGPSGSPSRAPSPRHSHSRLSPE